jgi:hypothetical protein
VSNYDQRYHECSREGEGYGIDGAVDDGDDLNDLAAEIGGELIHRSRATHLVAVYSTPDGLIAVGDAHGFWAVQI